MHVLITQDDTGKVGRLFATEAKAQEAMHAWFLAKVRNSGYEPALLGRGMDDYRTPEQVAAATRALAAVSKLTILWRVSIFPIVEE